MLRFIRALHISGMEDLLLYLASSDDERGFAFHVLEIISLMFREQVIIIGYRMSVIGHVYIYCSHLINRTELKMNFQNNNLRVIVLFN